MNPKNMFPLLTSYRTILLTALVVFMASLYGYQALQLHGCRKSNVDLLNVSMRIQRADDSLQWQVGQQVELAKKDSIISYRTHQLISKNEKIELLAHRNFTLLERLRAINNYIEGRQLLGDSTCGTEL